MLGFLTRAEIYDVVLAQVAGVARSMKKVELVAFVRQHIDPEAFMAALDTNRILVQRRADIVRYFLFLYFGRIRDSLSQFTMRDLGLVRTQDFNDTYEPRFGDREEALEHYYFARLLGEAGKLHHDKLAAMAADIADWPAPNFPGSTSLRDELAFKLGRMAERAGDSDTALTFYRAGESAECSERLVRILLAAGDREAARKHLEACLDDPRSDEEWLFARDLYEQKYNKKRTTSLTDMLRSAETVHIDESRSGAPERAVVEYFEQQGLRSYRTENLLWRTFFGLLFWDELFAADDARMHSPFELLPAALTNGTFYEGKRECLEAKLDGLRNRAAAKLELLKTSTENYATPNGVFRWRQSSNDAVFALLDHAPHEALASVLRRMCLD